MGKSNTDIKREKFIKKFLLVMIPVQILLIFLFVCTFDMPDAPNLEECISDVIIVEKKERVTEFPRHKYVLIYSNGVKYQYPNYGIFAKYSSNEFYRAIEEGQRLSIIYIKSEGYFSQTTNLLLGVKSEDETYLDFEEYKAGVAPKKTGTIIFVSVLEFLFLAAAAFTIYAKNSELKFFGRRKKKKKKKVEKTE